MLQSFSVSLIWQSIQFYIDFYKNESTEKHYRCILFVTSLTMRNMLVENSVLLIDFSTDRGLYKSVVVNLYIPIDSPFQNLQKHIFFKHNKYWPPSNLKHIILSTRFCVFFACVQPNFTHKVIVNIKTNNRFGISIKNWVHLRIVQILSFTFSSSKIRPMSLSKFNRKMNFTKAAVWTVAIKVKCSGMLIKPKKTDE